MDPEAAQRSSPCLSPWTPRDNREKEKLQCKPSVEQSEVQTSDSRGIAAALVWSCGTPQQRGYWRWFSHQIINHSSPSTDVCPHSDDFLHRSPTISMYHRQRSEFLHAFQEPLFWISMNFHNHHHCDCLAGPQLSETQTVEEFTVLFNTLHTTRTQVFNHCYSQEDNGAVRCGSQHLSYTRTPEATTHNLHMCPRSSTIRRNVDHTLTTTSLLAILVVVPVSQLNMSEHQTRHPSKVYVHTIVQTDTKVTSPVPWQMTH